MSTLRIARLEAWALSMVTRVNAHERVEDARVELKREWPAPQKAARRLAGHANAVAGVEILWIIGLDEDDGVVGAGSAELADWWAGTQSQFDGVAPSMTDIRLDVGDKSLCALVFETTRAPYVVNNPAHGSQGGESVSKEVPWRDGTRVRSANRNELLRILVPAAVVPEIEVLEGDGVAKPYVVATEPRVCGTELEFSLSMYMTPRGESATVVPFHRCTCVATGASVEQRIEKFQVSLSRPRAYRGEGRDHSDSVTMERTSNELIVTGPGKCHLKAAIDLMEFPKWLLNRGLQLTFSLAIIDANVPLCIRVKATPTNLVGDETARWILKQA